MKQIWQDLKEYWPMVLLAFLFVIGWTLVNL